MQTARRTSPWPLELKRPTKPKPGTLRLRFGEPVSGAYDVEPLSAPHATGSALFGVFMLGMSLAALGLYLGLLIVTRIINALGK